MSVPLVCFGKSANPKEGDYAQVEIPANTEDKRIESAIILDKADIPGVETIEGKLKLSDKGFGFVDDTFVSPDLVKQDMKDQHLKVLRFKGFDKRKNKMGWRAVKVELI